MKTSQQMNKNCQECGKPMPKHKQKWCSDQCCRIAGKRRKTEMLLLRG